MNLRVCRASGCGVQIVNAYLCAAHRKPSGAKRSAAARGYDGPHTRLRREWEPQVAAGRVCCARCGAWIPPGAPWDLGHTADRTAYTGPECRACNRAEGAARGNRARRR